MKGWLILFLGLAVVGGASASSSTQALSGPWQEYPGVILSPDDLEAMPPGRPFTIPGVWKNAGRWDYGGKQPYGQATYRLVFVAPERDVGWALQTQYQDSAYRLFLNGKVVLENGEVGTSAPTSKPQWRPQFQAVSLRSGENTLVLQISNYHNHKSGPVNPLVLGEYEDIRQRVFQKDLVMTLAAGFFLMMAVYHLMLFALQRSHREYLAFGLFCLLMFVRVFCTEKYAEIAFPQADLFELVLRLGYLSFYLTLPVLLVFVRHLCQETLPRWVYLPLLVLTSLYSATVPFLPIPLLQASLPSFQALYLVVSLALLAATFLAIPSGRLGAKRFFAGFLLLSATSLNDNAHEVLRDNGTPLLFYLVPLGVTVFILLQASVLAQQFSAAFVRVEQRVRERTKELQAANAQLLQADRSRTAFFSNISHELKTPITLIKSPLDELAAGCQGPQVSVNHPHLQIARRNAERLFHLVTNILRGLELDDHLSFTGAVPIDLLSSCRLHSVEFSPLARAKGVVFEITEGPWPLVLGHPQGLEIILVNLFSNALKYSPPEGRIFLSAVRGAGSVQLRVRDEGPGVPADQRAGLFQRFRRVYDSARHDYEGTGLGLSISRELALRTAGDLRLEEGAPPGACFVLELPEAPQDAVTEPQAAYTALSESGCSDPEAVETTEEHGVAAGRALVLVVEDNEDLRRFLEVSLSPRLAVLTAGDGLEGLEALRGNPGIDLALVDVMMPHLDGFGFVDEARRLAPTLPILFLTARDIPSERLQGLSHGAVDYLSKPFAVQELEAKIHSIVGLARQTREAARRQLEDRVRSALDAPQPGPPLKPGLGDFGLSEREKGVARLVIEGLGNKQIGDRLGIAPHRVANICTELYRKTGSASRLELMKKLG